MADLVWELVLRELAMELVAEFVGSYWGNGGRVSEEVCGEFVGD